MSSNLSRQLRIAKVPVRSRGGVVAAQNQKAADVGASGGNAVDASIATAFALTALEPWMSGLGCIGFKTVWVARQKRGHVVDFGAISARALDPRDYPLTGREGSDLFGWPEVEANRNVQGFSAIAVPGQPEGMRAAHERFGSKPWGELLAPAIDLAEDGFEADWFATLIIATAAPVLAGFPASAAWFLPGGFPPGLDWSGKPSRRRNATLARTLKRLASHGARDFYDGALADSLVKDLAAGGSRIDQKELSSFRARIVEPIDMSHAGKRLLAPGGLTAGPTLADALARIAGRVGPGADGKTYIAYAEALLAANAMRLDTMGEARTAAECTTHNHIRILQPHIAAGNAESLAGAPGEGAHMMRPRCEAS